ncbi:alpha-1,6-mannosyltransferase [Allokutzneria albata]|uniref:Alpha-1,6-mannosyltransferase n=1 Tax=Allokutzneria albata TaxID=211114 RepID=A0A1G9R4V1_ALLAB|nr:alpha-1,6-mannosyltransferase [Allokutzneria albata]
MFSGVRAGEKTPPAVDSAGLDAGPLDTAELHQLDWVRRLGTLGALLMAVGAAGAGAAPVFNPVPRVPLIGLLPRVPTVSMAIVYTGMFLVIVSWLWLGRLTASGRPRVISRSQMDRTLVMWMIPLAIAPPMFSRDVYSYLAQSKIAFLGLDPYEVGPAQALGVDDPLTRGVPNVWRDTPAPYGPFFLTLGKLISWIAGDHVVTSVLLHRVIALAGIAMMLWAVPRLARRCGVRPVTALWLGPANPLVLFHLVSGVHNEALMVGLMLAGLEIALRPGLRWILIGATLMTCAAAVKVSAAPALGFLGVALALRWGGTFKDLFRAAGLLTAVFVGVLAIIVFGSGLALGWEDSLVALEKIQSWKSPMTWLGGLGGSLGVLLGFGDHTAAVTGAWRVAGAIGAGVVLVWLLWTCFRRGERYLHPITGLGIALGTMVVLGPIVHPWYLVWAVVPLAASTNSLRFRVVAVVLSIAMSVVDTPPGANYGGREFVVPWAIFAGLAVAGPLLLAVRRRMPGRVRSGRAASP